MKKTLCFLSLILIVMSLHSQNPASINYQGLARDTNNLVLVNRAISIKMSLLSGSISGSVSYSETHQMSTDANGLFSIKIGQGSVLAGNFSVLNWGSTTFFLKIELDPNGGSNYQWVGTFPFSSVPYAMYAAESGGSWSKKGNAGTLDSIHFLGTTDNVPFNFKVNNQKAGRIDTLGSTFLGYKSGNAYTSGIGNTAYGNQSLAQNAGGSFNTAIGSNAGLNNNGSSNVFIGYKAGFNETGSNKLYVSNSETSNPLIYGDFSNIRVGIGTGTPATTLQVNGVITATGGNSTNWNTAYGWGNHSGLYRPISWNPSWPDVTGKPTFATVATSGNYNDLTNVPTTNGSETKIYGGANVYINGVGTTANPYIINANSGSSSGGFTHYIGELFGGGIVFYVWKDAYGTEHGLVASLTDLVGISLGGVMAIWIQWSNVTSGYANASSSVDGLANTNAIIAQSGHTYSAAYLCTQYSNEGYNDWYLPSIYELSLCQSAAFVINTVLGEWGWTVPFYGDPGYWSSNEYMGEAFYQDFSTGTRMHFPKSNYNCVRAVRRY